MASADDDNKLERALVWVVVILVAYRVAYHASYLGEVPFAHATFADGAVYEQAARDILAHPPLGSEAFYLQGAYAYLLALGMAIQAWPSLGLLVQLLLAFATLWLFHRVVVRLWGRRAGLLSTIALLAHPGLAFYENKYVSAELGVACNVLVIAGFVALLRVTLGPNSSEARQGPRLLAALGLGLGSGLSILARPNMVVALPFTLIAVALLAREDAGSGVRPWQRAGLTVATTLLGTTLALAPMAARNLAVTGYPDVQPVHGGGTSFLIGNNAKSKGVWNDADLLSARLGTESQELVVALGIDPGLPTRERARAIGDALYARSFKWIADHPGTWVKLEFHKLWLTLGDQQLTQDYDWLGERELLPWAHRVGVSFSMLLALGLLGAGVVLGGRWQPREGNEPATGAPAFVRTASSRRALGWFLAGQVGAVLAANLLYFTSAQHRLPLVVPLAVLAGPGVLGLVAWAGPRLGALVGGRGHEPGELAPKGSVQLTLPRWLLVLAGIALLQGPWPRSHRDQPHPVHYYNLAMVQDVIGEPRDALASLNRALELRPAQPIFLMRRAHLRFRLGDLDGSEQDLAVVFDLATQGEVPEWVLVQARIYRDDVAIERRSNPR
ncbi:putative O-linked GlcNAc transferase-putative TPR-containing transmembrane protein [Enhygromyxa salina]|uniref:Putative O-linked GlcNAc transferase-putative TPR-containing transmembrane protein n=1 Tax=Enhygromyxa salina TaxID=215803 RepID=A0A0C2DFP3_9BACT|nr:tetratricopeptide repeat protein [Enhygromyxa salina]KIG18452.1 putative O-linked GlcNAc transferase-putative TPR-containing transmembrane protein [Enhygromyxa salina]